MKRLTIFPLNTVIRYSESDMRRIFFEVVEEQLKLNIKEDFKSNITNHQALLDLVAEQNGLELSEEETEKIQKGVKKSVKKLYLQDEDAFDVRPGVQNLFNHLEKDSDWKFGILSDFWNSTTQFIMQSCGVSSKNKLTICAESASSAQVQIDTLIKRVAKDPKPKVHLVSLKKSPPYLRESFKLIRPKASDKESNYYVYPKFNEIFKLKKKKSKKDKSK